MDPAGLECVALFSSLTALKLGADDADVTNVDDASLSVLSLAPCLASLSLRRCRYGSCLH